MKHMKAINAKELANNLGIDYFEIEAKHRLIDRIIAAREEQDMTQEDFADLCSVTQAYISKLESKTRTRNVTIDQLLKYLSRLGYDYTINLTKRDPGRDGKRA